MINILAFADRICCTLFPFVLKLQLTVKKIDFNIVANNTNVYLHVDL